MSQFFRVFCVGLAVLALALMAATAVAQPPRGGPGGPGAGPGMMAGFGGGGLVGLVRSAQVREHLKLSDEQLGQLVRLGEELDAKRREAFSGMQGFRDLSEEERQARFAESREKADKLAKEAEKNLSEVLTTEQFQRLKQIELQQQGVRALLREDIMQALGITDDQRQKLEAMGEEARDKMRELFQGARDMSPEERGGLRDKMQALQRELEKSAMALLSDEQKATLKQTMGEPFELERPEFRGFGRGEGGRGARGGAEGGRRGEGRGADRPRRPEA